MGASTSSKVYDAGQIDGSYTEPISTDGLAAACLTSTDEEIIKLMFPVYFINEPLTQDEVQLAKDSWMLIVQNKGKLFVDLQAKSGKLGDNNNNNKSGRDDDDDNDPMSCISLFFETFYRRLFSAHPEAEPMFSSGIKKQGRFLVSMISVSLNCLNNEEIFKKKMTDLADTHNKRGIKANEYGLVGDVLFYSLHHVLGSEVYNKDCHRAWAKVFSHMLKHIIPNAVSYEIKSGSVDQKERISKLTK